MKHVNLATMVLALTASSAYAQESLAGPRLFPRGCREPGVVEVGVIVNTQTYRFALKSLAGVTKVEYRVNLSDPVVLQGMIRVEEHTTGIVPIEKGGLTYRDAAPLFPPNDPRGVILSPEALDQNAGTTMQSSFDTATGVLTLQYQDTHNVTGSIRNKTYSFRLRGRSLEITVDGDPLQMSAADNYAGFSFAGGILPTIPSLPVNVEPVVHIPYMDHIPVFFGGTPTAFCTRFMDWYVSSGSDFDQQALLAPDFTPYSVPPGGTFTGGTNPATYSNSAGNLNAPIHEVCYVTVSKVIEDTFPVIDRPPSEYRLHTASRAVSQNGPANGYANAKIWVDQAREIGLADMAHIKWDWTKWPHNLNEPDMLPNTGATPCGTIWGTSTEWLDFVDSCNQGNWNMVPYLWGSPMDSGYANLTLKLPDNPTVQEVLLGSNPLYDPAVCTRFANGALKQGWDTNFNLADTNLAGMGHTTDVIGPHKRKVIIGQAVKEIHEDDGFSTGGVHIDAMTEIPGQLDIDQMANSGFDHTIAESLRSIEQYFRETKDGMTGPLFGENSHVRYRAFESFQAGLLDGTSRKIPMNWSSLPYATNSDAVVIPDFEFREVLPRATGFYGMGWESHFMDASPTGFYPVELTFQNPWHTTLLSYGHAAYFSTNGYNGGAGGYWDWDGILRSYYLVHGLSKAMRSSTIKAIKYFDAAGIGYDLSGALTIGLDLKFARIQITFENGLEFKANHSLTPWLQTSVLGIPWDIPKNGFVGAAPNGLLAFSAINPDPSNPLGFRADYSYEPGFCEMMDRRGRNQSYNGFPPATPVNPINDPGGDSIIVHDLLTEQFYFALRTQRAVVPSGTAPGGILLRIDSDDTTVMSLGRQRLGLRATLILVAVGSGLERDVTGLVNWSSSNSSIVAVNRMGGLVAGPTPGQALITATGPTPGLFATQTISVDYSPIISRPNLVNATSVQAMINCSTDSDCGIVTLQVDPPSPGIPIIVPARQDPARKWHTFHVTGLQAATAYTATATATNGLGFSRSSAVLTFTTP